MVCVIGGIHFHPMNQYPVKENMMNLQSKVDHFIVLMQENRSFDHFLGFLRSPGYPIAGLDGTESNFLDPNNPGAGHYLVTPTAGSRDPAIDPGHGFNPAAITQLYGLSDDDRRERRVFPDTTPANNGFVYDYTDRLKGRPEDIMKCFAPASLPVLTTLAREFAVCDHWFSSVPGPTWPNRLFMHAATSDGYLGGALKLSDLPTIFNFLRDGGRSCTIYFHDLPQSLALLRLVMQDGLLGLFKPIDAFWRDLEAGQLSDYVFIEPRYFDQPGAPANDQHPSNDVQEGEKLIASIYNALRASPLWPRSALIVTYDENGGTYDHVPPPRSVSPDGKQGQDDDGSERMMAFQFDRLGCRVPAVVVSPWIPRATIDTRVHDHTAILALLEKRYGLPHLTARDRWAADNDLGTLFSLDQARTDTPTNVMPLNVPRALAAGAGLDMVAGRAGGSRATNDLQRELLELAALLLRHDNALCAMRLRALDTLREDDAASYLREVMRRLMQ